MRLRVISLTLLSLLTTGCSGIQSTLNPAGPAARDISDLSWIVYIVFCAVGVIMWISLAWAVMRRRGSLAEHEPVDVGGGQGWIITGGFIIPFVILASIFVLGLKTLAAFPVHDGSHMTPEIRVTGRQWWWQLDYLNGPVDQQFKTANEIHIPVGRPIDIELVSADVIHSFWIPKLHGKEDLIPGQPNLIRVQADQPGVYQGQCAEYCGEQHAHMMLVVVAQPEAEYQAWAMSQRDNSAQPANAGLTQGQQLFMEHACAFCHTIRGTDAAGTLGPDLTHVGSRRGLAANMLRNDTANLAAWITHAQALKTGSQMPNITQFTGDQLQMLVAYLQSLQ